MNITKISSNIKFNLFQNFKKVNFKLEPYPHIIINNALPDTIYNKLYNEFPSNIFLIII